MNFQTTSKLLIAVLMSLLLFSCSDEGSSNSSETRSDNSPENDTVDFSDSEADQPVDVQTGDIIACDGGTASGTTGDVVINDTTILGESSSSESIVDGECE